MTSQHIAAPSLTAHIEERILAPLRRNAFAARTWFLVSLAVILALHGSLLALLLYRDAAEPRKMAALETPVEVVVEPPKDEPKPPAKAPPPPKPQAKPEIEKPASSAPRAPNEDKVDTTSLDKETHAPKAPKPPADGKPEPANDPASPSDDPAKPEKTEETPANKSEAVEKDAEALDKAAPLPPKRPEKLAKPTPRAKVRRAKTALEQLAGTSALPDYSFARPTKRSPVYGGSEDSRYLAIVYGMIMMHRPRVDLRGGAGSVTVTFEVDEDGSLVGITVAQSSGDRALDMAAAVAIRRASPFPPPPPGAPHSLVATIDFSQEAPAYTMGSRDR